jgi:hypothetical protein
MVPRKNEEGLLAESTLNGEGGSGLMPSESGERCYCGTMMTQINTCKFQCPNCGALLDCEDVSGLPK